MSIAIAVNDVLNVRLIYGQPPLTDAAYNVLHYKVSSMAGPVPAVEAALSAIGQAMFSKFYPLWKVLAGADVLMEGVSVTDCFPPPRSVTVQYNPGASSPGTGGTEALPLQDAPTLLKTTPVGQRWGKGRLFIVGLAEALQDTGNVVAGAVANANTFGAALADGVSVALGGWSAVLTPILLSGPEDNPTRQTVITGGRLSNTVIKSQRRRRPGKGT